MLALKTLYVLAFSEQAPENFGVKAGTNIIGDDEGLVKTKSGDTKNKNETVATAESTKEKEFSSCSGNSNDKSNPVKNDIQKEIFTDTSKKSSSSNNANNAWSKDSNQFVQDGTQTNNTVNQRKKLSDSEELTNKHKGRYHSNAPSIKLMRKEYSYCHGDSGGIVIKVNDDVAMETDDIMRRLTVENVMGKQTDDDIMKMINDDIVDDDVMGTLTSVSGTMSDEMRATCLVELLVAVKNDDLAGEFFLHLMTKLTAIISNEDDSAVGGK